MAGIILGSIKKVTARQGLKQSSTFAIVNEAACELAFMNTSNDAPKSVSIGLVKVKVRADKLWDIQEGYETATPSFLKEITVAAAVKQNVLMFVAYFILLEAVNEHLPKVLIGVP